MSERLTNNPERGARLAIADYLSVGPEPNFGEVEVAALDEWISLCEGAPLDGHSETNVAWMHAERAWSRVTEAGLLTKQLPLDIKKAVRQDLADANSFFTRAKLIASPVLASRISVAQLSLPMLDLSLNGSGREIFPGSMAQYIDAQSIALEEQFKQFKQAGTAHDVPGIYSATGMILLTAQFLDTDYIPLPSATRHWSGTGSHYDYWHAVIYDRDNGRRHKVRFAPQGPPGVLLVPPSVMLNDVFPSTHGFGTAEALVHIHKVRRSVRTANPLAPNPAAGHHIDAVDSAVESCITAQLPILQGRGKQETVEMITEPRTWYERLSPFLDPGHPAFGDALERAISELELQAAQDQLAPDDMRTLGCMYMESAMSMSAQRQNSGDLLVGSFGRAEDLFSEAMRASPEGSSRFYELGIAATAAPMHQAIRQQEQVEAAIDKYTERLTILTDFMLDVYDNLKDKNSAEGQALWNLLQLATIYIALTGEPSKTRIITPVSPRQHGGGNTPRGWDFTVWEWAGPDRYEPGVFHGRLSDQEDMRSLEDGVMTIGLRALGQWAARHNFETLRSVLAEQNPALPSAAKKVDHKLLSKVRRNLYRLTYEAQ